MQQTGRRSVENDKQVDVSEVLRKWRASVLSCHQQVTH
jgi:hypothetical protein